MLTSTMMKTMKIINQEAMKKVKLFLTFYFNIESTNLCMEISSHENS